jgi:hypothetical protein
MGNPNKLTREGVIDPEDVREVTLGERSYAMLPQPIGYLRSQFGVALGNVENIDIDASNILNLLVERGYGLLKVFIPDLMPEWEFNGYATRESWEAGEYDMEYDKSPTTKQIRRAFTAAVELNEIDILKHLGKVIGPDLVKGLVVEALQKSIAASEKSAMLSAQSTQPSTPESSSTPSQTSSPGSAPAATESLISSA